MPGLVPGIDFLEIGEKFKAVERSTGAVLTISRPDQYALANADAASTFHQKCLLKNCSVCRRGGRPGVVS
jgi:hypothetical protein